MAVAYKTRVVRVSGDGIDADDIIAHIIRHTAQGLAKEIGPQMAEVAKHRAPVSDAGDSRRGQVQLKTLGSFQDPDRAQRLAELHSAAEATFSHRKTAEGKIVRVSAGRRGLSEAVTSKDAQFFTGTGRHKGQAPASLDVSRGTVRGVFAHRPGTLRDSIKFDGVRVNGNKVSASVTAYAPYAKFVHDGFQHKGGKRVAGRPFLRWALVNVLPRLRDSKFYTG